MRVLVVIRTSIEVDRLFYNVQQQLTSLPTAIGQARFRDVADQPPLPTHSPPAVRDLIKGALSGS